MAFILLKNSPKLDGHKDNGIKHCHRADKTTTLLEPSFNVLYIKFGWGATSKNYGMDQKWRKMKIAAFFSRKLIISASILLRKSCLGSKLGDLRSGNPFM